MEEFDYYAARLAGFLEPECLLSVDLEDGQFPGKKIGRTRHRDPSEGVRAKPAGDEDFEASRVYWMEAFTALGATNLVRKLAICGGFPLEDPPGSDRGSPLML